VSNVVTLKQADEGRPHRGTIVALHCSGSSSAQWRKLAEAAEDGFDVRCLDLYGCGRTGGWTGEDAFTLADEGHGVVAAIDAVRGPVHLVGHSYGGAVALHAALRRAGHIASLSLYEPTLFHLLPAMGPEGGDAYAEISAVASAVARGVVTGDYCAAARRFVDYWSGNGSWHRLKPELQIELIRWIVKAPLDFRALFEDATPPAAYAGLACPVLVLRGEHAPPPTRLAAARLAEILPHVRAATVAGAGHMGPITHAAEVNARILDHIGRAGAIRQPWRIAV
jgi:pimeloyl-ACP methyl ester carboxylesterase